MSSVLDTVTGMGAIVVRKTQIQPLPSWSFWPRVGLSNRTFWMREIV